MYSIYFIYSVCLVYCIYLYILYTSYTLCILYLHIPCMLYMLHVLFTFYMYTVVKRTIKQCMSQLAGICSPSPLSPTVVGLSGSGQISNSRVHVLAYTGEHLGVHSCAYAHIFCGSVYTGVHTWRLEWIQVVSHQSSPQ